MLTGTSRSIGVVGVADSIEEAERTCEVALTHVEGDAIFVRHDIGKRELVQRRMDHMRQVREGGP
jgi:phosphoribosylamine--glycine ligase